MKHSWKRLFSMSQERRLGQLVQIFGAREVYMEGCRRVLQCEEHCICIQGSQRMRVEGEHLILKEMGNGALCACGRIRGVYFEE